MAGVVRYGGRKDEPSTSAGYRSYNSQRLSAVQPPRRRPPHHLLEAWYFWLGIALLVVSVSFSVFSPVDVMHVLIDETIGNSISQGPIRTGYL